MHRGGNRFPTRCTRSARTCRRRARRRRSGRSGSPRIRRTSNRRGSSRARYWLGGHAAQADRKQLLEDGIAAARTAVKLQPDKPEGHFWLAANMGALAESFGLRQGLKYRGDIKSELETVLRIDPAFQQGSADRALGRWYYKVPGLFGGSKKQSEEHLRKALTYNPQSTATLYFLAETLEDEGKKAEAKTMLDRVLAAPIDPDWAPEDREFKQKASKLLAEMRQLPASSFQLSSFQPDSVSTYRTRALTSYPAVPPAPCASAAAAARTRARGTRRT